MFYNKIVLVLSMMSLHGARGCFRAICGDSGLCLPSHEQCSAPSGGACANLWCCKKQDSGLSGIPPPSGECICVSDESFCGPNSDPFLYLQGGSNAGCSCCGCQNVCVPLLNNTLCPTYELPVGSCSNGRNKYCCKVDASTDPPTKTQCKCLKCCSGAWKVMGVCQTCCLPNL